MLQRLISYVFPNRCIFCGEKIPFDRYFCENCSIPEKPCVRMFNLKPGRKGLNSHILKVHSPALYEGYYRKSLHLYKFRKKTVFADSYAKLITDMGIYDKEADFITYVPLTKKKLRDRGYNQSELIARKISLYTQIPLKGTLIKIKDNSLQHTLTKDERRKNVKDVYEVSADVKGKNIILVDDIVTTGATLTACASLLYKAGALCVSGICTADAQTRNHSENTRKI